MATLVYVHNKETGEVSRKEFSTVDLEVENLYAYAEGGLRPVRIVEADQEDAPDPAEYYLFEEGALRPVRDAAPL